MVVGGDDGGWSAPCQEAEGGGHMELLGFFFHKLYFHKH